MTQNRINWAPIQYNTLVSGASGAISSVSPGTSAQILTSNGSSANPSYQNYPSLTPSIVIQKFTASGTYTPTTGMRYCKVEVFGAGGSGGGSTSSVAGHLAVSSGGGAGGYARDFYYQTDIGTSQTITIGAGGAAPTAGNNNGNAGGTTSFGSLLSATGGSGGVNSGDTTVGAVPSGGAGGVGTGGDLQLTGSAGGSGFAITTTSLSTSNAILLSGQGAYLGYGSGAIGRSLLSGSSGSAGNSAGNYGGGGSGACSTGVGGGTLAGGAGASGFVLITEWVFA